MTTKASPFVWYDVMTTDVAAAERFYSAVIGWTAADSGMADTKYSILRDGDTMVGGIMPIPDEIARHGVPPAWMGYVGVADVDAKAAEVVEAGGKVHRPPTDIPGVGRFAVIADPHGAGLIIFKPSTNDNADPVPLMAPKHIGWHELHAGDREEAFAFYEKLFGWTKVEANDMGGFIYQTFATGGKDAVGGVMTKMDSTPYPSWVYYISVADFDAAVARVKDHGGAVLMEPMQVPGGAWIAPAQDPQGAHFSLIGMRDAAK
ncbi:VOC family protein [Devosia algicola]|uniref:VOC family protein n=1 Tax=Devosia algicola TaxID=3026418 RepID=A0ABY7YRR7_9HYPH|nr:VOC family protein [Devosia algicola]WDR03892.1 VOC family protein [Devosia algicola]